MFKHLLIAGFLTVGLSSAAVAGTIFAAPDGLAPGNPLSGFGDPGLEPEFVPVRSGISCREGARIVRSAGFRGVRPVDCKRRHFVYYGFRHGRQFSIEVRAKSGSIRNVVRLRGGSDDYGDYGGSGYDDDYDNDYDD